MMAIKLVENIKEDLSTTVSLVKLINASIFIILSSRVESKAVVAGISRRKAYVTSPVAPKINSMLDVLILRAWKVEHSTLP